MPFHVGQKVVCVNDRLRKGQRWGKGHETAVKAGTIYTVREIVPGEPHGYDTDGLLVVEIVNRLDLYRRPAGPIFCEAFFCVNRIFPVQTTSIDVFMRMLTAVSPYWAEDGTASATCAPT